MTWRVDSLTALSVTVLRVRYAVVRARNTRWNCASDRLSVHLVFHKGIGKLHGQGRGIIVA
jgi:hypothetical protein